MHRVKAFLNGILALLILALLVVALALGARWGLSWLFEGVDPTISAAIVAAAATTLVSVLGVTLGRYLERRHQIDLDLREQKVPIYSEFIAGILSIFAADEDDEEDETLTEEESPDLIAFLHEITPKLMIWASNDVVTSWSKFRRAANKHPPIEYMFMMEDMLTAIRKDLGHSGIVERGALLGLYVNDIDDYVGQRRSPS